MEVHCVASGFWQRESPFVFSDIKTGGTRPGLSRPRQRPVWIKPWGKPSTAGTKMDRIYPNAVERDSRHGASGQRVKPRVAILIPCFNEELTIGRVVETFRAQLPQAAIYVYDNNSSDRTVAVASAAGAICREERQQGKGNVVRRMFADIEADVYVMVDGDGTYDAASVRRLIAPILYERADM